MAGNRMFQMRGLSELQAALRKLPDAMQEAALRNASAAGARIIQGEARRLVAVDTGTLRDSIVVARGYTHERKRHRIRGGVVVGIRGIGRFYAHLVEFGFSRRGPQPFLRPALENKAPEALRAIGEKVAREIGRAARRLGRWKYTRRMLRSIGRTKL